MNFKILVESVDLSIRYWCKFMNIDRTAVLTLLLVFFTGCDVTTDSTGCTIEGPESLMPDMARKIRIGTSKAELENVLGEADYSPAEGQYYFSTGGDCPLEGTERVAPCGVVTDFREYHDGRESVLTGTLQSCWWGPIAE